MAQRSDVKVVNLDEPVQFGEEETIKVLEVRKPTADDMRSMPANPDAQTMGHYMDLAARLSGQPPYVINNLGFGDFEKVMTAVANFMEPGRKTGGKN